MAAAEMIAKLFHARTAAHMAHLQTRSFAEHKALNEFYDDIVGLADSFAETYQGYFGLIMNYPSMSLPSGKACDWIEGLRDWLEQNRDSNCKGKTVLENINDELMGLCASTCYKLRFLDNPAMETMEPDADDAAYMKMGKWA